MIALAATNPHFTFFHKQTRAGACISQHLKHVPAVSSRCGADCHIQLDIDMEQTVNALLHLTFHYSSRYKYYKLSVANSCLLDSNEAKQRAAYDY